MSFLPLKAVRVGLSVLQGILLLVVMIKDRNKPKFPRR
jgi:hypothetical protein